MNELHRAAVRAATEGGAPARVFEVGPDAAVAGDGSTVHPFDGISITAWERADVATGRSE